MFVKLNIFLSEAFRLVLKPVKGPKVDLHAGFFKYWDWGFITLWCCTVKIYAGTEAELTMALLILINVTLFSAWEVFGSEGCFWLSCERIHT